VINKMLRDLDSRRAAGTIPVQSRESTAGIARGTLIVDDPDRASDKRHSSRLGVVMAALVVMLGGVAGAWWYLNQGEFLQHKVDQAKVASTTASGTAASAVAAASEPVAVGQMRTLDEAGNVPDKSLTVTPPVAAKVPATVAVPVPATGAVPRTGISQADMALKMDSTFTWSQRHDARSRPNAAGVPPAAPQRPPTERAVVSSALTVPAPVAPVSQSVASRSPALDALAQAQSLWRAGSRDAAMELVQEALSAAERASLASPSSGNPSVLAALARELARMELAEGQVSQALAMLTGLEPALSGFADVWALRGSAAQRLGRHQESASAYLMALKLRPNEARWMLGAAVSLAAQGQTAAAAELAEKARAGGVLSPEVATYLRQLGVPLRDR
jgi:hypothetical protein